MARGTKARIQRLTISEKHRTHGEFHIEVQRLLAYGPRLHPCQDDDSDLCHNRQ